MRVANPLTPDESVLRRSILPGMCGALAFNVDRRQGASASSRSAGSSPRPTRLGWQGLGASGGHGDRRARMRWLCCSPRRVTTPGRAAAAWSVIADDFGVIDVEIASSAPVRPALPGLHPARSASGAVVDGPRRRAARAIGAVGEVDPEVLTRFGIDAPAAGSGGSRWTSGPLTTVHPVARRASPR